MTTRQRGVATCLPLLSSWTCSSSSSLACVANSPRNSVRLLSICTTSLSTHARGAASALLSLLPRGRPLAEHARRRQQGWGTRVARRPPSREAREGHHDAEARGCLRRPVRVRVRVAPGSLPPSARHASFGSRPGLVLVLYRTMKPEWAAAGRQTFGGVIDGEIAKAPAEGGHYR